MGIEKKKYLIDTFMGIVYNKKSINKVIEENLKVIKTGNYIPDSIFIDILNKYNYEEYCKRIFPIIEETFSEEDLEELIKFFRSTVGQKIKSDKYINSFQKIGKGILRDIENEIILINENK